jgi:hypothetical protein
MTQRIVGLHGKLIRTKISTKSPQRNGKRQYCQLTKNKRTEQSNKLKH